MTTSENNKLNINKDFNDSNITINVNVITRSEIIENEPSDEYIEMVKAIHRGCSL